MSGELIVGGLFLLAILAALLCCILDDLEYCKFLSWRRKRK